ncbi:MAG: putative C-S lyase [Proteobacteria bacterium]|jgi:cysteine-S-conjugate beta-lyase|nr:putative C-S lyase [Pseudomonadota bacterium]
MSDAGNFDDFPNRVGTGAIKWEPEHLKAKFGVSDVLPMWVADMDFETAPCVVEALKKRLEHPLFGYTRVFERYRQAVIAWFESQHGWQIEQPWICHAPGIVAAMNLLIQALTAPGDKVVIQPPVYYPFFGSVRDNGRELLLNTLKIDGEGLYQIDFDQLEEQLADDKTRLFMLCNPHNPGGRVWARQDLISLVELCIRYDVVVLSDEIHCDLVWSPFKHLPLPLADKRILEQCVVCTASSKSFNLAGLQTSDIIIPSASLRRKYRAQLHRSGLSDPNIMGLVATEAAYRYGLPWLKELRTQLASNLEQVEAFFAQQLPGVILMSTQATYMVWFNLQSYGVMAKIAERTLLEHGKVALNPGYIFGAAGDDWMRINFACPPTTLSEGLQRIKRGLDAL